MQPFTKLLFFFLSIISTVSCKRPVSLGNLEDRHGLETTISRGIQLPFSGTDTVFLMPTQRLICMNPLPDETYLQRVYYSQLDSSTYLRVLSDHLAIPVLIWSDGMRARMDSISQRKLFVDSGTEKEDTVFYRNKAFLTINGTVLRNDSVKIYEQYWNQEKSLTIEKLFSYDGKRWSASILKETLRKRR